MEHPPRDPSLDSHVRRIESYLTRTGLARFPRTPSPLRTRLAELIAEHAQDMVSSWARTLGGAFGVPEAYWPQLAADLRAALGRWARHIADPENLDTYAYLRRHTRRGLISRFPASRFLCAQALFARSLSGALRRELAEDPELPELLDLLDQEFQERILLITDFFIEAREEELHEQAESYRAAVDRAPAAIVMLGADDPIVFDANRVAEHLTGYSRGALLGRSLWELHPRAEREEAEALWREAGLDGQANREGLHVLTRSGELVPVSATAGAIEYGEHRFVQLIWMDVSERKRLESQLIQSEKMAAIGQLAAGIAHEIRNPLAIIANALYDLHQLLPEAKPEVREDLRIAEEEIGRAQAIIDTLLEFSRPPAADLEPVDINDLVRRTLRLMRKYLQHHGVRVKASFAPLPPCLANQNALRQIFLNMITNAVQAMPGGGELRLRTGRGPGNRVLLEFEDTGVGIPEEQLRSIFNPFFTTKAPGQGTGLGLSVVHSVLQRYQGTISVRSRVGEGTTFTIFLPCPCEHEAAAGVRHGGGEPR